MTSNIEASNPSSSGALQLVPETILKKKHDLDELRAQRASHLLMHPKNRPARGAKQNNSSDKVFKPETILAAARSKRNHAIRWKRVAKKGMQARASNKKVLATKTRQDSTMQGPLDTPVEENYATNSVGAKLVFCVRVRDAFGMPSQVKKTLSKFGLRNIYEVCCPQKRLFCYSIAMISHGLIIYTPLTKCDLYHPGSLFKI